MTELQIIRQQEVLGQDFRVYGDFENPLFLARDVAEWIEYDLNKINEMVAMVDEDEKLTETISWSGQGRKMWFLTEDGLYEVLMQSRKPIAKAFKKEVKAILKQIRLSLYDAGRSSAPERPFTHAELEVIDLAMALKIMLDGCEEPERMKRLTCSILGIMDHQPERIQCDRKVRRHTKSMLSVLETAPVDIRTHVDEMLFGKGLPYRVVMEYLADQGIKLSQVSIKHYYHRKLNPEYKRPESTRRKSPAV